MFYSVKIYHKRVRSPSLNDTSCRRHNAQCDAARADEPFHEMTGFPLALQRTYSCEEAFMGLID